MNVKDILELLQDDKEVVVAGKTFEPTAFDEVRLETGESIYWVRDGAGVWLSVDPESEEVILFDDIEGDFDPSEDALIYNGEDFEFSYEGDGKFTEDGEELDKVLFRDYEGPDGRIIRLAESMANNEVTASLGRKVPEEELQAA